MLYVKIAERKAHEYSMKCELEFIFNVSFEANKYKLYKSAHHKTEEEEEKTNDGCDGWQPACVLKSQSAILQFEI